MKTNLTVDNINLIIKYSKQGKVDKLLKILIIKILFIYMVELAHLFLIRSRSLILLEENSKYFRKSIEISKLIYIDKLIIRIKNSRIILTIKEIGLIILLFCGKITEQIIKC
jgi:hypothetical protein